MGAALLPIHAWRSVGKFSTTWDAVNRLGSGLVLLPKPHESTRIRGYFVIQLDNRGGLESP